MATATATPESITIDSAEQPRYVPEWAKWSSVWKIRNTATGEFERNDKGREWSFHWPVQAHERIAKIEARIERRKVQAPKQNGRPRTVDARLSEMAREHKWFWQQHHHIQGDLDSERWRNLAAAWGIDAEQFDYLTTNAEHWKVYYDAKYGAQ